MALIVYDMQAGVLRQLPDGGAEAVARVARVLTAARAGGYPVFFTRHMSLPVRLMGTAQLRTAMAWQHVDSPEKVQSWFLRDTPGFEIVPDLCPRGDEAVFDKLAMSAFAGTPLEMALRDLGIRAFAIAGVALEIGIAPTVWHAVDLGLIPVVVTDACGGRDRPAMQRALDDFRFSGDTLLTDIAAITPLLLRAAAGERLNHG
jgi:biuret amidohydrolase